MIALHKHYIYLLIAHQDNKIKQENDHIKRKESARKK